MIIDQKWRAKGDIESVTAFNVPKNVTEYCGFLLQSSRNCFVVHTCSIIATSRFTLHISLVVLPYDNSLGSPRTNPSETRPVFSDRWYLGGSIVHDSGPHEKVPCDVGYGVDEGTLWQYAVDYCTCTKLLQTLSVKISGNTEILMTDTDAWYS